MENNNTDNREFDIKKGNYIELTEGNYTEAIARDYIQGDYLVNGHILTFNHTEIIQASSEGIKNREFIQTSPYKGLKKFDVEDKDLFFGRDQFLTGLVNELEQSNLILLMGASGSGKSSVVRAGLIPWLAQKWGSKFVKIILTPDRDPFDSFYASLLSKYKQSDAQIAREAKADTLHRVITKLKQPDEYWLIVLDQFEELFTTTQADKRDLFINSLVHLNKTQLNAVKIIGTMRADFLDKLSPHPKLAKITDKHRPLIAEMQPDELRLAIEQPAAHHGVIFEPELVPAILKDIQGQAGYLPLLQYTLKLLWGTEVEQGLSQNRTLKLETYHQIGRVQGALQKHVDAIYEALSPNEQQATQRIFLKLVDIGEDAASGGEWKPVRRRASKALFNDELEQGVLAKLIDEKLLVSDRSRDSQESTIDIAHEILLTSWTTLNTWIQENRKAIAIRNRLNNDLNLWKSQKSEAELWSGAKLEQVLELRIDPIFNQVLGGFSPEENQFIDLSRGLRDRQRRKTVMGLSSFSVVAVILLWGAVWQWRSATQSEIEASSLYSELLFNQGKILDSLIENLRITSKFKQPPFFMGKLPVSAWGTLFNSAYATDYYRLGNPEDYAITLAFSPDEKTLATANNDGTLKLYDISTKELIPIDQKAESQIFKVVFDSTGSRLAYSNGEGEVIILDSEKRQQINSFEAAKKRVVGLSFSLDNKRIATASEDQSIKVFNVTTGELIQTLAEQKKDIYSVQFSPNGELIAFGSQDNTIEVWKFTNGNVFQRYKTLKGHTEIVTSIAFIQDSQTIISGSLDDTIRVWDIATSQTTHTFKGHEAGIVSISLSRDETLLASGSRDRTIKIWDLNSKKQVKTLEGHQNKVIFVAFSPDDQTLASASDDRTTRLWNVKAKDQEDTIFEGHGNWVRSLAFSPTEPILASGSDDHTIKIWDTTKKPEREIITLNQHNDRVNSIMFSPDGKRLASGSKDNKIILWDIDKKGEVWKGEVWNTLQDHGDEVSSVAFSPDGKFLASGSSDKTIKIWNLATEQSIKNPSETIREHKAGVNRVVFSPNSKLLASGSSDKKIQIWDVSSWKSVLTFDRHTAAIHAITFSPDGKRLASGSADNTIHIWDVDKKLWESWDVKKDRYIRTLEGHKDLIRNLKFSPDGKILASSSRDGTIIFWNAKTGKQLALINNAKYNFFSIAFSPDGKTLASGTAEQEGKVILWEIDINQLITRGCNQVSHYLKTSKAVSESDKKMCDD
ncbi:hypothetical protein NG791_00410 [Laspinema sp. D1]|uniref:nSTAND1 domain-containing NTPase n=1 Tax=Laspinema palackyanum TaxID=3231601 RepID=UPI0034851F0C|nr:hypothetical protein [Laspinema sp. D2b]